MAMSVGPQLGNMGEAWWAPSVVVPDERYDVDPNSMTRPNLPAWLIVDQQFLARYFFVGTVPGREPPDFVARAESLDDLASKSAYDKFYGDPKHSPNPCLGTLEKAPFYAVEIHPGALGTKGGQVTDLDGRVLHVHGAPIEGLYAAGNVAASLAGADYPGPGITIGAALLWGHRAARHAARLR